MILTKKETTCSWAYQERVISKQDISEVAVGGAGKEKVEGAGKNEVEEAG